MDKIVLEKYKQAGQIAQQAKQFAHLLLKEGTSALDITNKVEAKILSLGGKLAFPVDVCINEVAAHYSPPLGDTTRLKKGDLVKIDLGVHVDGWIVDTAFSASIGKSRQNEILISAAEQALKKAMVLARPGVEVCKIGAVVQSSISSAGFQSIRNLMGHLVDQYTLHAGLSIPNYDTGNMTKLKEGMVIALEPFATNGEGIVIEGKDSDVYQLIKSVGILRIGREILDYIKKNYNELPFAKRWLMQKFGSLKTNLVLKNLLNKEIIKNFSILREKAGGAVAQAEHTLIVKDKPIILT